MVNVFFRRLSILKAIGFRAPASGLFIHCALAFSLWNCNLNDSEKGTLLRLNLPDSLSRENGKFDRVVIDLFDADSTLTHAAIFDDAYEKETDAPKLANIRLATKAPNPLLIKITAFKNDTARLILQIRVDDGKPTELVPIHPKRPSQGGDDPDPPPAERNTIFTLSPKSQTLYTGGEPGKVTINKVGDALDAKHHLGSSDTSIARVDSNGTVRAIKAGEAILKIGVEGNPAVTGECTVRVVTDPPIVTLSADQSIASGQMAVFQVSVTQAYGNVVSIRADMDGDGEFEQSVPNQVEAEFTRKYETVGIVPVKFQVEDSEGNIVTLSRKVSAAVRGAPIVDILNPSYDTTLNSLSFEMRFSIQDSANNIESTVDSMVFLKEGANSIRAARTNAWGEGADVVIITVDTTSPSLAISATPSTTGSADLTLSGTASDAGTGIQSVTLSGALSGNGTAELAAGLWSKSGLQLAEGLNTLVARATDRAGNSSIQTIAVTLDSRKPGIPVVSAPAASRTTLLKWTWTKANADGSGRFKVKVNNGEEVDVGMATEYSLTATGDNTHYGLSVQETDSVAGNGPWSAQKNILYDSRTPDPILSRNAAGTDSPKWTWKGNGGSGTFRWHYKGNAAGSAGTGNATEFAPANLSGGTHTLCVQELDSPEWGEVWGKIPENCLGIEVDKTGPVITEINPKDGFITNQPTITIRFKADGKADSFQCALADGAETICKSDAADSVGNKTPIQVKVWHRQNVIFVLKGVSGGKKDGSSWQDAFDELYQALDTGEVHPAGTEIWVSAGEYEADPEPKRFYIKGSDITILGGFPASGWPVAASARQPTLFESTLLENVWFSESANSILWDGFTHPYTFSRGGVMGSYGENITIRQCRFTTPDGGGGLNALVSLGGSTTPTIIQNCSFINLEVSGAAVSVSGKALISNCTFSGIKSHVNGPAIQVIGDGSAVAEASVFRNNRYSSEPYLPDNIAMISGTLTITGSQVEGGRESITGEGMVIYGSDNTEPQ